MEFLLQVQDKQHPSYMTNIFELKHLGIMNSSRMLLYVGGRLEDQIPVIKKVQELALCIIHFHGVQENRHPHPVGDRPPLSFHFSLTGNVQTLQSIRDQLQIKDNDPDHRMIEMVNDAHAMLIQQLGALALET